MRTMNLFIFIIIFFLFQISCSKKSEHIEREQVDNDKPNKELYSFDIDTNESKNVGRPISLDLMQKIFPKNILDLTLEKVNKGTINFSGISFNSVSAEYVSNNGLVVVYVYDYINFSHLPYHLRNLFELTPKEEIISIKDGIGRITSNELSHSKQLDVIYLKRFHIKVEAINYPNFRESATEIVNSLYLTVLSSSVKVGKDGKF